MDMPYRFEIEKLDGTFRGCTHQAVIYQGNRKVSTHKTRKGQTEAEAEARRVIKFYEKQAARDRAAA